MITDGPYVGTKEFLGGSAVVDVADDEAAKMWASGVGRSGARVVRGRTGGGEVEWASAPSDLRDL